MWRARPAAAASEVGGGGGGGGGATGKPKVIQFDFDLGRDSAEQCASVTPISLARLVEFPVDARLAERDSAERSASVSPRTREARRARGPGDEGMPMRGQGLVCGREKLDERVVLVTRACPCGAKG